MTITLGLDARAAVLDPLRGLGRVARALADALLERDDLEVVLFVHRDRDLPQRWYRRAAAVVHLRRPRRGAFLADGLAWAWTLRRHPVEVLHLPAWGVAPGIPVPVVATLHDVTPLRHPQAIPSARVRRRAVQRLATYRRATLVHAVSRATARDAIHALGIPPQRVRVVPNGVDPPAPASGAARDHVLYVGGADPHKRLGLLLEAWRRPEAATLPPLVIAGPAAADPAVRRAAGGGAGCVRLAGVVPEAELTELYRRAHAVLLPSLWEGFGLPALEGQAHGAVPVVTAAGALPEAGGDAALYLPPAAGPAAWAEAVRRLLAEPGLAGRLRRRGLARVAGRSWARTAEGLVELYGEAASRALTARP